MNEVLQHSDSKPVKNFSVVAEEEKVLKRVQKHLQIHREDRPSNPIDYDQDLIELRDQIINARVEDIPPLIQEMERLQQVAARRAKVTAGHVNPASPYFARLVLEEDGKKREVLIGKTTYLDSRTGIRIVDWRNAPVSRIYYRYDEGDDYEEDFGGRYVEGEVITRRSLAITHGKLRRITTPQATYVRSSGSQWREVPHEYIQLHGGQGVALRPESHHKPGQLGIGVDGDGRADRFLPEITALIDPRQFELITQPSTGIVVIQGGAGSGKTTIGLHRMAYLSFQDRKRFRPDKMLVVVFNRALAHYMSKVLPALGIQGVPVVTFENWASKLRRAHLALLPKDYTDETPAVVTRLKKHPIMLKLIDSYADALKTGFENDSKNFLSADGFDSKVGSVWQSGGSAPLVQRLERLSKWLSKVDASVLDGPARLHLKQLIERYRIRAHDVVEAWVDILGDKERLQNLLDKEDPEAFAKGELAVAHKWVVRHCELVAQEVERREQELRDRSDRDNFSGEDDDGRDIGVDGQLEHDMVYLDREDDALFLRLMQKLHGPLRHKKEVLRYEHVLVDEAQDLSPVELAVVHATVGEKQSMTFAGDLAQRIYMDNGFSTWEKVFSQLGLSHVEVEPLRLSYRSTHQIMEFAQHVLGPLANEDPGKATRSGAPVELFRFSHAGDAVGFLGEALRELVRREPLSSVAVIARHPEQADLYYNGLKTAEVPNLRRVANQDFTFKAGVDVTDVHQVKGLEFDYVVLLEASAAVYPNEDEARHLLHIAATRAAYQLWVTTTGEPSRLLPDTLVSAAL